MAEDVFYTAEKGSGFALRLMLCTVSGFGFLILMNFVGCAKQPMHIEQKHLNLCSCENLQLVQ